MVLLVEQVIILFQVGIVQENIVEMESEMTHLTGIVDNLLDEQSLQDTRLLNLELDTDQFEDQVESMSHNMMFCCANKNISQW